MSGLWKQAAIYWSLAGEASDLGKAVAVRDRYTASNMDTSIKAAVANFLSTSIHVVFYLSPVHQIHTLSIVALASRACRTTSLLSCLAT